MIDSTEVTILLGTIVFLALVPAAFRHSWWPWSAAAITVLLAMLYDALSSLAVGSWFYLGYALFATAPLLVFLVYVRFAERARPFAFGLTLPQGQTRRMVALALVLAGVYFVLTLEPGFLQGFTVPGLLDPETFAVFFLTTPLIALGQEAVFRGYFLTKVAGRHPFRHALFASSALFAVVSLNPFLFAEFSFISQVPTLFLTVGTGFVLGIFLGLFFYKAHWSLLGPWVFRSVVLGISLLFPVAVRGLGWETVFVLDLIALTAVIVVVFVGLREPRFEARHYLDEPLQPRRRTLLARARARRRAIPLVVVLGVAVLLVAFAGPIGSVTSRAPVRVLAIETGSMAPTFDRGTLVLIETVGGPSDLEVGDIVAYNAPYLSPNGPVVHRIVAIHLNGSQEVFTFKGDANPSPDPRPVVFSQVVGKVVTYVPYLGYLVLSPELSVSILLMLVLFGFYRGSPDATPVRRRRPVFPLRRERA
ncbi:MAG TPA: signal peptidase I [Thermoplasmata archaeon]|nr:signal peptidase I [Thermoplasmata archaeon]